MILYVMYSMSFFERTVSGEARVVASNVQVSGVIETGSLRIVQRIADLPYSAGNVITLPANSSWMLSANIDLQGRRLVMAGNVVLYGLSSETCALYSTGLPAGESLLTSAFTLNIRYITLGCPSNTSVFNLNGDGTNGLDMNFVNFGSTTLGCGSMGTISNFSNVIMDSMAILNVSGGITFNGTIGTIGIQNSIFASFPTVGAYITFPATLTVTRRFRMNLSSMVCFQTGILYQGATMPTLSLILNTINFSGPGTFVSGIDGTSLTALFIRCVGIQNSILLGQFTMNTNVIATPVVVNTWTPILGTAQVQPTFKFTYLDKVLTYAAALKGFFFININYSMSSGNNQTLDVTFARNGVPQAQYKTRQITTGAGEPNSGSLQGIAELNTGDYFNLVVRNITSSADITVGELSFIIYQINT